MSGRLRAFYFLYYGYVATSQGFLAPYLRGLGFSGDAIGAVAMAAQLTSVPAGLFWAHAADVRDSREKTLRFCAACGFCGLAFLPFARSPWQVGLTLVAYSLFASAIIPLADSISMEWAAANPLQSYARIRLFGSLGFVVVAQGLGLLLTARGDRGGDRLVPWATITAVLGYAIAALTLRRSAEAGGTAEHPAFFPAALRILSNPLVLLLFAVCLLHWGSCAPYHLLYGVLVRDHGLPSSLTGLGLALGVVAEVVALFAFPPLLRRFSLVALLGVSFAGTALRWLLLSRAHDAIGIVGLQLFHGLTFGIWWAAAVEAMRRSVPFALRATGQALFSAVVFGAGNAIGYALAGAGYERFGGASPLFAFAAAVELIALTISALAIARLGGVRATNA
ncbi:MAG: MFS transporter [Myxococcales bacterium]